MQKAYLKEYFKKRKSTWRAVSLVLLAAVLAGACGTVDIESGQDQATQSEFWSIRLTGIRTDLLDSRKFEEAKAHSCHYIEMELEKKGSLRTYGGMLLRQIVAMVDGTDAEHPYKSERLLWEAGYDITITAGDGYSVTFNTCDVPLDAIILADSENGNPISPSIVGGIPSGLWVKDVVEIELALGEMSGSTPGSDPELTAAGAYAYRLTLSLNGNEHSFSIDELTQSPFYTEGMGSFTTSAGTTYSGIWGGVKFAEIIRQFIPLNNNDMVTIAALDGYEMTYSGQEILDDSDGVWLLAFKLDGEYLPEDPGPIRTIKVGLQNPNINGHASVKMIKKIIMKGDSYRPFNLEIQGRLNFSLDRQTLQSGISCHKRTVFFERKGTAAHYTGIPLWRLLAYSDDPDYAPHKQDKSIISYNGELARAGYRVEIIAADGFKITLDSKELDGNEDVILAMYREGEELTGDEWPLIIVWDRDARLVPDGIKPVRQVTSINLVF